MVIVAVTFLILCIESATVDELLNKCISSNSHKNVPAKEGKAMESEHCTPWQNRSCCTWNTTQDIDRDGVLSLYNIVLDQCPKQQTVMSEKCKQHFKRDTCFYECSPNLGPWIVDMALPKKTRKDRFLAVPLCKADCDLWYSDCSEDYTCNDNWAKNWNWTNKGTPQMCTKQCKKFKEYFASAKTFCENLFDGSYAYHAKDDGECMNLIPVGDKNLNVARDRAKQIVSSSSNQNKHYTAVVLAGTVISVWVATFF